MTRRARLGAGRDLQLDVTVEAPSLAKGGMVMNSAELKALIASEVEPDFASTGAPGPGPEALLARGWSLLSARLPAGAKLARLDLEEGPGLSFRMSGEGTMLSLTVKADFSAAHRLHSAELSADENRSLFGKCNNPSGHGHNYVVEATLELAPGRVPAAADARRLQALVQEWADHFDHKHLNEDCAEFKAVNPTAENVCKVLFDLIKPRALPSRLRKISIRETEKNFFEYEE